MRDKPNIADVAPHVPEAALLEEIGEGGFKVVYRARIGESVEAVKLVRIPCGEGGEKARDEDFENGKDSVREENVRRIRRELKILQDCETPCLIKLGSIQPRECQIAGCDYVLYSEEHVPGESLRTRIRAGHRPDVGELACLGKCLLMAIQELAGRNVIHRDIKPDNVIQTEFQDRPYVLLDLGIAFQVGGTPITQDTHRIPGTLYYIAPEMLDAGFRQNIDYRADLYAAGLTLYEYGSGEQPFARQDDPQYTTLYRIKTQTPKALQELRPDLPPAFCGLVDQLLKKLPALRPSNIGALLKRMEGFL